MYIKTHDTVNQVVKCMHTVMMGIKQITKVGKGEYPVQSPQLRIIEVHGHDSVMAAGPSLKSVHFEVFGKVQGELEYMCTYNF